MGGHKKMTNPDVFMATQIFSWGCHEHGHLEIHPPLLTALAVSLKRVVSGEVRVS